MACEVGDPNCVILMPLLPEIIFPGAKQDITGSRVTVSYDLPLPVSSSPQGQNRAQGKETGGSHQAVAARGRPRSHGVLHKPSPGAATREEVLSSCLEGQLPQRDGGKGRE